MKRLIIGFVLALSLMLGAAGSAFAGPADSAACSAISGTAGASTVILTPAFDGGCEDHS